LFETAAVGLALTDLSARSLATETRRRRLSGFMDI